MLRGRNATCTAVVNEAACTSEIHSHITLQASLAWKFNRAPRQFLDLQHGWRAQRIRTSSLRGVSGSCKQFRCLLVCALDATVLQEHVIATFSLIEC